MDVKLVFLILSFLFAFAAGWKSKQQFTFSVEGRNLVGLPGLKQQYTGLNFNGTILVQAHDSATFLLQFQNMTMSKLHGSFENWWDSDEDMEVKSKQLGLSAAPFIIQMQRNMVKKITVSSKLKDWERNFMKGIVNQLFLPVSVNSDNERRQGNDNSIHKLKGSSGFSYTAMEDSVVGKCEVQYDIVKIPENAVGLGNIWTNSMKKSLCGRSNLFEVTRTYNFSNCDFLAETHFNFPSSKEDMNCKPGGSSCENFWKRSTLSRSIGCGDSYGFILLDSSMSSRMSANLQMNDESEAVVLSKLNITIMKAEPVRSGSFQSIMPKDVNYMHDFFYSYTPKKVWDVSSPCSGKLKEENSDKRDERRKISDFLFNSYKEKMKAKDNHRSKRSRHSKHQENRKSEKSLGGVNKDDFDYVDEDMNKMSEYDNLKFDNNQNFGDRNNKNSYKNDFDGEQDNTNINGQNHKYNSDNIRGQHDNKQRISQHSKLNYFDSNTNSDNYYKSKGNDFGENDYNANNFNGNKENKKVHDFSTYEKNFQQGYEGNINNFDETDKSGAKNLWNPLPAGMHDPPFMPLTPLALAHKEADARSCDLQIFNDIIEQIAYDLANEYILVEEGTMERISFAIDICRLMTFKELSGVSDSLFHPSSSNTTFSDISIVKRDLYRDIIVSCGTRPALSLIGKWIQDNQLGTDEIAIMFTLLPARLLSADKNTVNYYFELTKKLSDFKNEEVSIAAILGFSNYVRISCIQNSAKLNRFNPHVEELCDSTDAEKYVNWMSARQKGVNSKMFRVYSLAIGNTGSRSAVKILRSIGNNYHLTRYQRTSAITAMKYLTLYYPDETEPVLYSLYINYTAPVTIRITALSTLIFSSPSLTVWQRIAISTWYEPNLAVKSFIQSTIASLSDGSQQYTGIHQNLVKSASLVQHLMRPLDSYSRKSGAYNILTSSYMEEMGSNIFEQSSWISSGSSMSVYHRHYTGMGAFSTSFEEEFSAANPDGFLSSLKSLLFPQNEDITQARPPMSGLKLSTRWLHETFRFVPRNPPSVEGDIRFKINNVVEALFPFDNKTPVSFAAWGKEFWYQLKNTEGIQKNIRKIDMSSTILSTTTELGFPVRLELRVPWVLQSEGNMKVVDRKSLNITFSMKISSTMNGELSLFTPWDNTAYITGIHGSCFAQIPKMKLNIELDDVSSSVVIRADAINESQLLFHSTFPFTSQKDLLVNQLISSNANTRIIHVGEMEQITFNPLTQLTGVYSSEGKMYNIFETLSTTKLSHHPIMWHSNKLTHIEIRLNKIGETVMNFSLQNAVVEDGDVNLQESWNMNYFDLGNQYQNKAKKLVTRSIWDSITGLFSGNSGNSTTTEVPSTSTTATSSETVNPTTFEAQTTIESTTNVSTTVESTTVLSEAPVTNSSSDTQSATETTTAVTFPASIPIEKDVIFETMSYENNGEVFNASILDPFNNQVNGSSQLYVISKVLNGIKSGQAFVISLDATFHKTNGYVNSYSGIFTYGNTYSKNLRRFGYFATSNDSNWQSGLTATLEIPSLPAYDLEMLGKVETQPNFAVDYYHQQDEQKNFFNAMGVIDYKTSVYNLRKEIEVCRRPKNTASTVCRKLYELLTSFGGVRLDVSVNSEKNSNGTDLNNFADLMAVFGRYYLEKHDSHSMRSSDADLLHISIITDKDSSHWNAWINSSMVDAYYKGIPLPQKPISAAVTLYEELSQINSQYCGIADNSIVTFDGVEFNYNMSDCWHVAMKDCSGKSRFFVLTRALKNSTFLDLEINLDNYRIITISEQGIQVNGESAIVSPNNITTAVYDKAGAKMARIKQTVDYALEILLPVHRFKITYTNTSAVIYTYPGMQGRLCGLCGDYNLETFGELVDPKGARVLSPFEYGLSYSIGKEDCVKLI